MEGYHPTVASGDPLGLLGQVLHGQFRVDELVEDGPRSILYRGIHLMLEVPIAIKCMKTPDGAEHEQFVAHFRHEGRLHYKLSQANPHFVRVLASGTAVSSATSRLTPFVVLEWLEGQSLATNFAERRAQRKKGRSLSETMRLLESAAEAMAFAHAVGIVHRELTPHTLFLVGDRTDKRARKTVKVVNFGVAKIVAERALDVPPSSQSMGRQRLAYPNYAAPEQYSAKLGPVSPRSDVYALALIVLEMLRDRPVFEETDERARPRVLSPEGRPTPTALGIEVSPRVEAVLAKAVALRPEDRPADAGTFWTLLRGATAADRDSLQRVSKLPLTMPNPAVMGAQSSDKGRNTMPEDMRVTLSGVEPATVPRVAAEIVALANSEVSYSDIEPDDEDEASSEDTLEMGPEDLKKLDAALERLASPPASGPRFPGVPRAVAPPPRPVAESIVAYPVTPRPAPPSPSSANHTPDAHAAKVELPHVFVSPLAPVTKPRSRQPGSVGIGVLITLAFVTVVALLCSGLTAAAYFGMI